MTHILANVTVKIVSFYWNLSVERTGCSEHAYLRRNVRGAS